MARAGGSTTRGRRGRPRGLDRRRLYTGGAMMVLAPLGLAGCQGDGAARDAVAVAPADVVGDLPERPDGWVDPEVIAIAPPFDPGPETGLPDAGEIPFPDVVVLAPFDPGPGDPADPGPPDPGADLPPEIIAIAPLDVGPGDPGPSDPGADAGTPGGPGSPCGSEADCRADLFCQPTAICIVPTECCGGCECQPYPCNPQQPACPEGSGCVGVGTQGACVRGAPQAVPGGFLAPCKADADCSQEYFCRQTLFCIAPAPGCGATQCVPQACGAGGACPEGSTCIPYDLAAGEDGPKTCARLDSGTPPAPGTLAGRCATDADCASAQHFCVDACAMQGMMCIVPVILCEPVACDPAKADCPQGAACRDVGIGNACVKTS